MKYKLGTKISDPYYGKGKIKHYDIGDGLYLAEFKKPHCSLHSGREPYSGKYSSCLWYSEDELEPMLIGTES